jgi:transposase
LGGLAVIRIDAAWLATAPLDMRAGTDTALARVIATFGAAHPHHAYVFANQRANRLKILVHDGVGLWLAARRLHQGKFVWAPPGSPNVAWNTPSSTRWCWVCPGSAWARKAPSP